MNMQQGDIIKKYRTCASSQPAEKQEFQKVHWCLLGIWRLLFHPGDEWEFIIGIKVYDWNWNI